MEKGLCFDRGFLGDGGWLLQCLHHACMRGFRGRFENGGTSDCFTQQFSRGFGHYTD